jgi:hypothetical protein
LVVSESRTHRASLSDELHRPRPAELGLQSLPQNAEANRLLPALHGCGEGQRPGLAHQQRQVVDRVVHNLLAAPGEAVAGDDAIGNDDLNNVDRPHDP